MKLPLEFFQNIRLAFEAEIISQNGVKQPQTGYLSSDDQKNSRFLFIICYNSIHGEVMYWASSTANGAYCYDRAITKPAVMVMETQKMKAKR